MQVQLLERQEDARVAEAIAKLQDRGAANEEIYRAVTSSSPFAWEDSVKRIDPALHAELKKIDNKKGASKRFLSHAQGVLWVDWQGYLRETAHDPGSIDWDYQSIRSSILTNGGANGRWVIEISEEFSGNNGFGGRVRGRATGRASCQAIDWQVNECEVISANVSG